MLPTPRAIGSLLLVIAACAVPTGSTAASDPSEISRLEALLIDPEPDVDIAALHGALGDQYLAQRDAKRALEHYDQLLGSHPDHPRGQYRRGEALQRLGRMREAIGAFELAGSLGYTRQRTGPSRGS